MSGTAAAEVEWFTPSGTAMTGQNWNDPNSRCVCVYLDGSDDPDRDKDGVRLIDSDLLLLVNGWREAVEFTIPDARPDATWSIELDSADQAAAASAPTVLTTAAAVAVAPWSIILLASPPPGVR